MPMTLSDRQEIIMNFGAPPSLDDFQMIARSICETLPDELVALVENLDVDVQDFPDETIEMDQNLDDPYELLALYQSSKELTPGVEKKSAEGNDTLILYRRPILDYWCESGEQFEFALRQIIVEEIARQEDFTEDDIKDMLRQHHQGFL